MKTKTLIRSAFISALATQAWADAPNMKTTTQVPDGIATPNTLAP